MKKYDFKSFESPSRVTEFLNKNQYYFPVSITLSVTGNWTLFYYQIEPPSYYHETIPA